MNSVHFFGEFGASFFRFLVVFVTIPGALNFGGRSLNFAGAPFLKPHVMTVVCLFACLSVDP